MCLAFLLCRSTILPVHRAPPCYTCVVATAALHPTTVVVVKSSLRHGGCLTRERMELANAFSALEVAGDDEDVGKDAIHEKRNAKCAASAVLRSRWRTLLSPLSFPRRTRDDADDDMQDPLVWIDLEMTGLVRS